MALYRNISNTTNIFAIATLAAMAGGCVGSSSETVGSKEISLIELPARIQRSAVLNNSAEGLKACAWVREEGVTSEATCQVMELVGAKAKLIIPDLKANTRYVVSIEFSFDSETYGKVILATVEKTMTTVAGANRLSFGDDTYQYPDEDEDGWDNHRELERGTHPYVVNNITRTSLVEVGSVDCLYGGTLIETGIDENANEVLDDNEVNARDNICEEVASIELIELPTRIQRSAMLNNSEEGLKACARVKEEGVASEATCQVMELVGAKAKLIIPDLKANTHYVVSIEFSFDSETYGKVILATAEKNTTIVAGTNRLSFGDDTYQYPDEDEDGWDNHRELERGTHPYVVNNITRTSLIDVDSVDCLYGGMLIETGIDKNANGVLDDNEVNAKDKICKDAPKIINESASWKDAAPITSNNLGDAWKPQVAVDDSRNVVAVWQEHDGTHYNIWASQLAPDTDWGTATLIETNDIGDAVSPQVVLDGDGNALVVWQQNDGVRENIWANRFVSGVGWETATLIETNNAGDAVSPQLAVDGSGNVVTVWRQNDGMGAEDIWAKRFDSNIGWEVAVIIDSDTVGGTWAGGAWAPQIAVDSAGNAVAVWVQWWNGNLKVWANRFSPDNGWRGAKLIQVADAGRSDYPHVAMDGSGNAVVVWQQMDDNRSNIWANIFVQDSGWGTAELIKTDNSGDAWSPQAAVDSKGNVVTVWYQTGGGTKNIWANHFVPGQGWGIASLIENNTIGDAISPQVVVGSNGSAMAIWLNMDETRNSIWVNRFVKETGWGTAERIEIDSSGDVWNPQVVVDSNGDAVAVWSQSGYYGNTFFDIWANRFQKN